MRPGHENLLVILVTVALAYFTYDALKEVPAPVVPTAVVVATPAPAKIFYHSPLDAPPMSPGQSTGMGYYSASADSRFSGGAAGASSFSSGGTTNYYGVERQSSTALQNPSTAVGASSRSAVNNVQFERPVPKSTPAPVGIAR